MSVLAAKHSDLPSLDHSSSSSSSSSISSLRTRRIRFAPLPDPRALAPHDDDDDPDPDAPIDCSNLDDTLHTLDIIDSRPSSLCSYDMSDRASVGSTKAATQPSSPAPWSSRPKSDGFFAKFPFKPKAINLFRPFPFSSHSTSSSIDSTPTPTLETPTPTNLSRTSSKQNDTASWGLSLTRWTSGGSQSSKLDAPLARTQSSQSYTSRAKAEKRRSATSLASFASSPAPKPAPRLPTPAKHQGVRMLNGRVYGAPKNRHKNQNSNPFANIRDEEPEFVEWGYGGMGSVRGGRHAGVIGGEDDGSRTRWERLHATSAVNERKASGELVNEEDDGTGMAWLKKRREAREKKEREEREKAEQDKSNTEAGDPSSASPSDPVGETTTPSSTTPTTAIGPSESPATPTPVVATPSPSVDHASGPSSPFKAELPVILEHNLTAITVPARHGHRRMASRSISSEGVAPTIATLVSPGATSAPLSTRRGDPVSSSDDEDSEGNEDDSDDDESEKEEDIRRKTALGAGVEKISRHNN